ncbi:MAG: hypothetical protein ABUK01_07600 [Leptospirales bacterium]
MIIPNVIIYRKSFQLVKNEGQLCIVNLNIEKHGRRSSKVFRGVKGGGPPHTSWVRTAECYRNISMDALCEV